MNNRNDDKNELKRKDLRWLIVVIGLGAILLGGLIYGGFFSAFHNHKFDQIKPGETLRKTLENLNKKR